MPILRLGRTTAPLEPFIKMQIKREGHSLLAFRLRGLRPGLA